MQKPEKITLSFNRDFEGVYVLMGVDNEFYKKYIEENQHKNILKSCFESYFQNESISLLNQSIDIEKKSLELLKKATDLV